MIYWNKSNNIEVYTEKLNTLHLELQADKSPFPPRQSVGIYLSTVFFIFIKSFKTHTYICIYIYRGLFLFVLGIPLGHYR